MTLTTATWVYTLYWTQSVVSATALGAHASPLPCKWSRPRAPSPRRRRKCDATDLDQYKRGSPLLPSLITTVIATLLIGSGVLWPKRSTATLAPDTTTRIPLSFLPGSRAWLVTTHGTIACLTMTMLSGSRVLELVMLTVNAGLIILALLYSTMCHMTTAPGSTMTNSQEDSVPDLQELTRKPEIEPRSDPKAQPFSAIQLISELTMSLSLAVTSCTVLLA